MADLAISGASCVVVGPGVPGVALGSIILATANGAQGVRVQGIDGEVITGRSEA